MKNILGSIVMTLVFLFAVTLFLGEQKTYQQQTERIAVLKTRLRLARKQQSEMAQKKRTLKEIRSFMEKAEKYHLKTDQWTSYDVQLDDGYIFEDLKRILNQCANASAYMFKPKSLHIKIKPPHDDEPELPLKQGQSKPKEAIEKDSLITLKGTFFAKRP